MKQTIIDPIIHSPKINLGYKDAALTWNSFFKIKNLKRSTTNRQRRMSTSTLWTISTTSTSSFIIEDLILQALRHEARFLITSSRRFHSLSSILCSTLGLCRVSSLLYIPIAFYQQFVRFRMIPRHRACSCLYEELKLKSHHMERASHWNTQHSLARHRFSGYL